MSLSYICECVRDILNISLPFPTGFKIWASMSSEKAFFWATRQRSSLITEWTMLDIALTSERNEASKNIQYLWYAREGEICGAVNFLYDRTPYLAQT
jgi:hypothetical protein